MGTTQKKQVFLSPNFSLAEALASETAARKRIKNDTGSEHILNNMYNTASQMELVRLALGSNPILINSWYRSPELNAAVGGSKSSQHMLGEAVDFICPRFGNPLEICKKILASNISFDQLILEHTWVHISFKNPSSKNRNQVLSLLSNGKYATGLTNKTGKPYKL